MALLGKIRAMHLRDGKSISEIARLTSLSRNTIKKWLKASAVAAPKYHRRDVPGKLAPHVDALLQALKADAQRPKRERRTVKALHAELKAAGYAGGYTRLTDYVRAWRMKQGASVSTGAFVPLAFELGEAFQFDWSEEGLVVGGIYRRLQVAHMKLCASRAFWLVAYPSQGHEMLFDAHTRSFAALGGVARRGIYDNMKTAVDKVNKGKGRVVNARFAALCAHYLVDADFCNVASGWEKGRVEKNVQDSRRRVWIDAAKQRFGNFDELNAWLGVRCRGLWSEVRHPEHSQFSVAEVLEHERAHLMPMPEPFDGYVEQPARVSSTCLVAVQRNRYSVPCELAGQMVSARLYPTRVVVVADEAIVAHHEPRPDEVRLAALHPAGAAQARRLAQRRTVRRHAPAAARAAGRVDALARRRPRHGAGAGGRAHRGPGRGAGGRRVGAGERRRECRACAQRAGAAQRRGRA
jgi:transposase